MAAERPRLRRAFLPPRALSLRLRITLTASIAVAIALVVGALAVRELQSDALRDNIDDSLEVRAGDLEALLADGRLPQVLRVRDVEEALVQVVGPDGALVATSGNLDAPLARAFLPQGKLEIRTLSGLPIEDEPFRILAQRFPSADGEFLIYVAESLDAVEEASDALIRALLIAVPLLILFVAVLTWFVVGRALSPVEAIRAEVGSITDRELSRRVPEPASSDEIGRLARTMNAMLGRLQAAQERQRRFVADASHELRSPLTNIRAQVEVDLARPDDAQPLETEQAVLTETLRLERLVDDLLTLARADESQAGRFTPVDIDDIAFQEIERIRPQTAVRIDASAISGAQISGDPAQLSRLVRNVLENAVRYADEHVVLTLSERAETVTLTVSDDGPGIPHADQERIFQRFTRLDEARARAAGGAGLGLAIAREIATRHQGTIRVDPVYEPGARLIVTLPTRRSSTGPGPRFARLPRGRVPTLPRWGAWPVGIGFRE